MDAEGPDPLSIPAEFHDAMIAHCLREAPLECCGLLGGSGSVVSSTHPLRNVAASAVRYLADPVQVIEANRWLRDRGGEILAIYHSHPSSAPIPSRVDLAENYWGAMPRVIVSLAGPSPEVRIWRLDADSYDEIRWTITSGSPGDREPG